VRCGAVEMGDENLVEGVGCGEYIAGFFFTTIILRALVGGGGQRGERGRGREATDSPGFSLFLF